MKGGKVRSIAFLFSDMDGTPLHPDQRLSPSNILQRYNQ